MAEVIDITTILDERHEFMVRVNSYSAICPECEAADEWEALIKEEGRGYVLTALVCHSEVCNGKTFIDASDGRMGRHHGR